MEEEEVIEYNDETDDTSVGNSLEERSDDLGSPGSLEEICKSDHDLALPKDYPKVSNNHHLCPFFHDSCLYSCKAGKVSSLVLLI